MKKERWQIPIKCIVKKPKNIDTKIFVKLFKPVFRKKNIVIEANNIPYKNPNIGENIYSKPPPSENIGNPKVPSKR